MATLSRGQTFGATETVTNTKLHNLVDLGSVSNIVDADVSASAAIQDTKLEDITTAGKVRGTAILNLPSLASAAGVIPMNLISLVSIPNQSIYPLTLADWVSGTSVRDLASFPTNKGIFNYKTIVTSMASGAIPQYDGANNFKGTDIADLNGVFSNVIFQWAGVYSSTQEFEIYEGTDLTPDTAGVLQYRFLHADGDFNIFYTVFEFKWTKIPDVDIVNVHAAIWQNRPTDGVVSLKVDIGGANTTIAGSAGQVTPEEVSGSIDVTSLTDGTNYTVTVSLANTGANDSTADVYMGHISLEGSR